MVMIQDETKIQKQMRRSKLVSVSPRLQIRRESKKDQKVYYPQYSVTFYAEDGYISTLLRVYLPILLVAPSNLRRDRYFVGVYGLARTKSVSYQPKITELMSNPVVNGH